MALEKTDVARIDDVELANPGGAVGSEKSGLAGHGEMLLSPEEARENRRYVLKLDFIILPLCAIMYFLATLVS